MNPVIDPSSFPRNLSHDDIVTLAEVAMRFPLSEQWQAIARHLTPEQKVQINEKIDSIKQSKPVVPYHKLFPEGQGLNDKTWNDMLDVEGRFKFYGNMGQPETAEEYKQRYGDWPQGHKPKVQQVSLKDAVTGSTFKVSISITETQKEIYYKKLHTSPDIIDDRYVSPSGAFELKLSYEGEYLRGDSHHYGKVIEIKNDFVVWQYKRGDKIRQLVFYPWSHDSRTIYFQTIAHGNDICMYNLGEKGHNVIYRAKRSENRLNSVHFVSPSFNGVVFSTRTWPNKVEKTEYLIYHNLKSDFLNLTELFIEPFNVCPVPVPDCIGLFAENNFHLFNVKQEQLVFTYPWPLLAEGYVLSSRPTTLHTGELYLELTHQESEDKKFILMTFA